MLPDAVRLLMTTPEGDVAVELRVPGRHNVANALAATAASVAAGATLEDVRFGLGGFAGVAGRLRMSRSPRGARIIDDSYNANPGSLGAALEVLAGFEGETTAVLGDMLELGAGEIELHAEAGRRARELGVNRLLCIGELSVHSARAFGPGATHMASVEALCDALATHTGAGDVVLVKGSRGMRMERVVQFLEQLGRADGKE